MVVISGADMQLAIRGISWLPNLLLHLYILHTINITNTISNSIKHAL